MAVKFSQFNVETDVANVGYLVGYDGTDNVQITPANLISSSSIIDGSGTATKLPKWVDAETLTDSILTEDATGFITVGGNFVISGTSGDTLTLIKSTTEPSLRIEGDTNKDFVITISGELLTFTQNDGATDILTLDHDTGNAVLNGGSLSINRSTTNSEAGIIDFDSGGFEFTADAAGTGYPITFNGGTSGSVAELMRIDPGGDVGIGTDAPTTKLHLGGTAPLDSIIRQDSTASGTNWEIGEREAGKWQIFEDDGDSIVATFMSTGNVGIGITAPVPKLALGTGVAKTDTGAQESLYIGQSNEASNYAALQVYTVGGASAADRKWVFQTLEAGVANAGNLVLQQDGGKVGIGTASPHNDVSGLSIAVAGSTDQLYLERTGSGTGRYYLGTASDSFYIVDDVAASTRMTINSAGNVGIGTTGPTSDAIVRVLEIEDSTSTSAGIALDAAATYSIYSSSSSTLVFRDETNAASRMIVDSSGNVGIGTINPTAIAGYTSLEINNATTGGILDLSQGDVMRGRLVATTSSLSLETSGSIPHYFYLNGQNRLHLHTDGTVEASYINTGAAGFYFNGISQVGNSGTVAGNATVSLTFTNVDDSSLYIECVFNHYGFISTYGCSLVALFSNGPNLSSQEIQRTDSANGGAWSISRTNGTTFVVAKSAGTYAGAGAWYVKINGNRVYAA